MIKRLLAALVLVTGISGAATAQMAAPQAPAGLTKDGVSDAQRDIRSWDMTVITAEEIAHSNARTVADVLRDAAGVFIADLGPAGSGERASLRGSQYAQVLVLLDGIRLNSLRDGGVDLSALPVTLDEVERIEIARGPTPLRYGADAIGGVVNIITKRAQTDTVTRLGGSIGSHGYDTLAADSSGRDGAASYFLGGTRETSDGYRQNSDLEQWTMTGRLGYDVNKDGSLDVSANYLSKEHGVPGSTTVPSPLARQWDRQTVLGASYRQKISSGFDLLVRTSRIDDMLRYQDPASGEDSEHLSRTQDSQAQFTWVAGVWSAFTVGYETKRDVLDSTATGDHGSNVQSWYAQDDVAMGDSLNMVVGTRYDKYEVYGEQWSPRASARYLFSKVGTVVRISYEENYQVPSFNDLYWPNTGGASGNPDLVPETAKESDAGLEQSLGKGSSVKVTGFKRSVENLIEWKEFAPAQWRPENIGKATITGMDAELALRFSDTASLTANYTHLNPVDETTGEKIYYAPKEQIKGMLTFAADTDVYITAGGRSVKNYVAAGEPRWQYSVYDAKIAQKIGRKGTTHGEIYFAMTNVFDRKYENTKGYPMPPREIRGGLMVPF